MSKNIWKLVCLKFQGALHLSRGRLDSYDRSELRLHSDKLKSALLASLYEFGMPDEADLLLEDCLVSSCFPFANFQDELLYFLPNALLPLRAIRIEGLEENRRIKTLKKVTYISHAAFVQLYQQPRNEPLRLTLDCISEDGKFLHTEPIKGLEVYKTDVTQHVYVNRDFGSDNATFYVDRLYLQPSCGLYFLIQARHEDVINHLVTALELLADAGIGTDRSAGYGQFEFDRSKDLIDLPFALEARGTAQMNLSLYCPKQDELGGIDQSSYKLIKRGGYIASPMDTDHLTLRKKSVHMFQEGSVFLKRPDREGKIIDLKPDNARLKSQQIQIGHPIWRDGRSIFLTINNVEL